MKREELKALGLTDEQINGVMENYGKSVKELQDGLDDGAKRVGKRKSGAEEVSKGRGELHRYRRTRTTENV